MIRFIVRREIRDNGDTRSQLETLDAECPALESILALRGGHGGGAKNDNYDLTHVVGAEVRAKDGKS